MHIYYAIHKYIYLDMLFLGKLRFNIIHLSLHDFSVQNFTLCITTILSN